MDDNIRTYDEIYLRERYFKNILGGFEHLADIILHK